MDGLLSCIGLMICVAMAVIAGLLGNWSVACVSTALAGALLGFLRYNSPPASIFMGDCGSMVVGLTVGVIAIQGSLKGTATVALTAPLAILTLPILDTLAAIVRRKLTGRSIYAADRGHLHHCLLRSGLTTPRVLLCVLLLSAVTLAGALVSVVWHAEWIAIVSALAVVGILVATRLFGHSEYVLLKKRMVNKFFRGSGEDGGHQVEVRIQGSADWPSLWHDLTAWADDLNLHSICLDINAPALHEAYLGRWEREGHEPEDHNAWRAHIPLTAAGHNMGRLEIVGRRDDGSASAKIALLAGLVEDLEFALGATVGLVGSYATSRLATGAVPLSRISANGDGDTAVLVESGNGQAHSGGEKGNGHLPTPKKPR
jgi:UDP-GlcNAc:undecaprenyl-phosphate GlcNAc-1-phosphate transferase